MSDTLRDVVWRMKANDATLTVLDLGTYKIGDAGAHDVADALRRNTSVTELHLGSNQIGDTGARDLADALRHNTSVTMLGLYNNQIGDAGVRNLADALRHNTSVTMFDLCLNRISDAGVRDLADALRHNPSVATLSLQYNNFGDALAQEIYGLLSPPGLKQRVADARERAEAERIAHERTEAERIARERAEAERIARERAEAERVARERAEAERVARERAEAERIARERAEAERTARERAEAERIARERAEAERRARAQWLDPLCARLHASDPTLSALDISDLKFDAAAIGALATAAADNTCVRQLTRRRDDDYGAPLALKLLELVATRNGAAAAQQPAPLPPLASAASSASIRTPKLLPRASIARGKLLGKGASGKVYAGTMNGSTPVAIKEFDVEIDAPSFDQFEPLVQRYDCGDAAARDALVQALAARYPDIAHEWAVQSSCTHPHVAQAFGFVLESLLEDQIIVWLVLELADGSMDKWLKKTQPGPAALRDAFLGVCYGLQALHRMEGIVHADLKPGNVLGWWVTATTAAPRFKIGDFGLSRTMASSLVSAHLGTATHSAPEQCATSMRLHSSIDIWSLGIMLAEAFGGNVSVWPGAPNASAISFALRSAWVRDSNGRELPEGMQLPAGLPASIERVVVEGCLRREQADRWSIEQVIAALKAAAL